MEETKKYAIMGERIRKCRMEMRLSEKEVAYIMQVKVENYLHYEAGEKDIKISKLLLLSRLFHVSCDYLLGLTDRKWPPRQRQE